MAWAVGWMTRKSWFSSQQGGKEFFLPYRIKTGSKWPIQLPVPMVTGTLPCKSQPGCEATSEF